MTNTRELLVEVMITGRDEAMAEAILIMAAKHSISASNCLEDKEGIVKESEIVKTSLHCFYSELCSKLP